MNKVKEICYSIFYKLIKALDIFRNFIQVMNYKGFKMYYSKGTSLVEMIRKNPPGSYYRTYEADLSNKIIQLLKEHKKPVFLDIGANIGLNTLNVLSELPQTQVFAFEPGPHQFSLFKKTIKKNNLNDNITLINRALSYKTGTAQFASHVTKHASGDGFLDTGRAGDYKNIEVLLETLDNWWIRSNLPQVDVVKIDTEGAELWVLKGGQKFIKKCKPIIFLEISLDNIKQYPYNEKAILNFLSNANYILKTLDDKLITTEKFSTYLQRDINFVAYSN